MKQSHVRVLQILAQVDGGWLSRAEIGRRIGGPDWTGRNLVFYATAAIGYVDPKKRAAFERGEAGGSKGPSLLTLKYVESRLVDVDGIEEDIIRITPLGRKELSKVGPVELPPLTPHREPSTTE